MAQIIITVPVREDDYESAADYVEYVATQLLNGYTSGHVDSNTHWTIAN